MLEGIINLFYNNVIPCTINAFAVIYLLSKILGRKLNFKDYKLYISVAFLVITAILIFFYVNDSVRIVVSTITIFIANYILFRDSINRTLLSTIIEQTILLVAEISFVLILILFVSGDSQFLRSNYYGEMITVLCISILSIMFVNLKFMKKLYSKLMQSLERLNEKYVTSLVVLFMVVINVLLFSVFHDIELLSILIVNLLFMFIYGFIMYHGILNKSNMIKIEAKNQVLVNNLEEYEKMLDHQRTSNHENKNQLLAIKGMLKKENSDALKYINEIISDKLVDDDSTFDKTKLIPSGGLQGIVYQKMLVMDEKGINFYIDISDNMKDINFDKIDSKLNYDLCRIIGVFLDNAIEEVLKLEYKEIRINLYENEKNIVFEISNVFKDAPDLFRLDEVGFTTKGKGHGYGLSLVKNIVESNGNICNEREICRNVFTQILKVKI